MYTTQSNSVTQNGVSFADNERLADSSARSAFLATRGIRLATSPDWPPVHVSHVRAQTVGNCLVESLYDNADKYMTLPSSLPMPVQMPDPRRQGGRGDEFSLWWGSWPSSGVYKVAGPSAFQLVPLFN
ncbi:LOW QUALITY PROTEIN: hypothetical protein IFM46972_10035 [Aspergillus udagawae]|uniref:Uncharacterized protein n=1 Tax=Aspergillus udagawae TaxID=91492 RepID=A0A8H3S9X9_9EURO|nr:LOW QUALITY PROTEIN: hypothetical protein IFM46972_10035 [Aspergillus udagawae]